jgi:CubicO group peptidase (beta-lactamase class C family)
MTCKPASRVEKLTVKSYAEALKERITSKIGLKDTYTATGNIDVNKNDVGTYSTPDAPAKATVTRDDSTLFFQPPGASSGVPLEATAEDKFQIEGVAVFTFDAAKNQMTVKRRGGERVFTKEK